MADFKAKLAGILIQIDESITNINRNLFTLRNFEI